MRVGRGEREEGRHGSGSHRVELVAKQLGHVLVQVGFVRRERAVVFGERLPRVLPPDIGQILRSQLVCLHRLRLHRIDDEPRRDLLLLRERPRRSTVAQRRAARRLQLTRDELRYLVRVSVRVMSFEMRELPG